MVMVTDENKKNYCMFILNYIFINTVFLTNLDRLRHRTVTVPYPHRHRTVPPPYPSVPTVPQRTHRTPPYPPFFTLFGLKKLKNGGYGEVR